MVFLDVILLKYCSNKFQMLTIKKVTLNQVNPNIDPDSSHKNYSKLLCVGFMML